MQAELKTLLQVQTADNYQEAVRKLGWENVAIHGIENGNVRLTARAGTDALRAQFYRYADASNNEGWLMEIPCPMLNAFIFSAAADYDEVNKVPDQPVHAIPRQHSKPQVRVSDIQPENDLSTALLPKNSVGAIDFKRAAECFRIAFQKLGSAQPYQGRKFQLDYDKSKSITFLCSLPPSMAEFLNEQSIAVTVATACKIDLPTQYQSLAAALNNYIASLPAAHEKAALVTAIKAEAQTTTPSVGYK